MQRRRITHNIDTLSSFYSLSQASLLGEDDTTRHAKKNEIDAQEGCKSTPIP
jgi:hypothetical protein